jgi:PAS domain S-box-containing protein
VNRILQRLRPPSGTGLGWVRYLAALAACVVAFLVAWFGHPGGEPAFPFLAGFAALIISAAWAGPGPGVAASIVCAGWAAVVLMRDGRSVESALAGCAIFLGEGLLLSACSARMMHLASAATSSETRHRQLAETTPEGIWLQDNNSAITWANTRMAELLGVPIERVIGSKVEDFYFPSDLTIERIRADSLGAGMRQQYDRRLRRADGTEIWVLACCNGIADESGGAGGSLAMMTDITERKRAEHALRRSEQRYRSLFENVLEGVYQSTPDGRIIAANPMLLKMLGCNTEAELRQLNIAQDLYVDANIRRKLLEQLERDGSFQNVEYELRTAQGDIISVLENARVIRDENGAVLHYEGTLTDITERKRVEEQLRQAQKVEAVGRLAAGVAQDFSTVLRVITANMESAIGNLPASHPARFPAEEALRAATGASALTQQLLSFSRRPADLAGSDLVSRNLLQMAVGHDLPRGTGVRETILLVEDEPLVRELSRDMLERQGYRVVLAGGPREAERIGAASESVFDLLITGSAELARNLRVVHPILKVLFISGYEDPAADQTQPVIPHSGFLQKPFSADSLGRRIRQLLDES